MQRRALRIWAARVALGVFALLALAALAVWLFLRASLPKLDGEVRAAGLHAPVSVARDAHGVPLIAGTNRDDVAYATGFVQAQERFFQMDLLRRVGAGELAELFGPRAVALDEPRRLHRFRARAAAVLQAMPASDRRLLERYVNGVNAGLGALDARPFEYALVGAAPRPWTAADSLLVIWAMYIDLQGKHEARELARGWIAEHSDAAQRDFLLPESSVWDAPLDARRIDAPATPIPARAPAWWGRSPAADAPPTPPSSDSVDHLGSNNWAIAGSRSKDGAAIVSDDMHLNIKLPNTWYRVAFQFPDAGGTVRRMVGVTLPGAPPLLVVGSNGRVAWGFTNSYGDFLDLVEVGTDPAKPGQVRTPAGWERPAEFTESILVKGGPARSLVVRESSLGPLRVVGGRSYAIHWTAHAPDAINLNSRLLEDVATLDEALAAAATIGIPQQNFVAGDTRGNIGWTLTGLLPRRTQAGAGATFPLAADGAAQTWSGRLAPSEHPTLRNPASGQLSTANSRQLAGPGAALIGDGGLDLGARNHQVRERLEALGDGADVGGAYRVALDDRALFLAPWRLRAIAALDANALAGNAARAQFLELLRNSWNGRASVDSVGYRLTRNFMWTVHDLLFEGVNGEIARLDAKASVALASKRWPVVVARLLDEQPAAWLPPGHADWRALQLAAIDRVIAELTTNGARLADARWGERNKVAIAHPISLAVPFLTPWLSAPPDLLPGDAHMPRVAGRSFGQSQRMTVTPGKEAQGLFTMPGGQSGHPLSPFFLRGHDAWVRGEAAPLLPGPARHTLTFVK
ncbi:penicillin acylase family protein [Massilia glaciei]|uniref:Penicillin acylase family protein n=1 Tax=Massilia glaciei TaxID=1524097 RepID=A0A2U2I482_9BURK|nr:penicillin acylase family protein [Massilia glaciei]PWF54618.1 penicillin acylase family protein [Massilia glaciei]